MMPLVGAETVVGPGPSPPLLSTTDLGSLLVRAGHKRFFFDACHNHHGRFLRITEVPPRRPGASRRWLSEAA